MVRCDRVGQTGFHIFFSADLKINTQTGIRWSINYKKFSISPSLSTVFLYLEQLFHYGG